MNVARMFCDWRRCAAALLLLACAAGCSWMPFLRKPADFEVTFKASDIPAGYTVDAARNEVAAVLQHRLQAWRTTVTAGTTATTVHVHVPNLNDKDKPLVTRLLQQPGHLRFHVVHPGNDRLVAEMASTPADVSTVPTGYRVVTQKEGAGETPLIVRERPEPIRGRDVQRAWATPGTFSGFDIELQFTPAGTAAFAKITAANVRNRLAIIVDGKVYSAPVIREPITCGTCQITGRFTVNEAQALANVLNSGELPVPVEVSAVPAKK